MNKIRVRLLIENGNYTDYEIETKVKSQSGFKDFIKRELDKVETKVVYYRFDLIINGLTTNTIMTYPAFDKRFF